MANAIVAFSVKKLWDLVSQEYERLKGVEEQVTELKSVLNMLMSFLKDVDAKKQTSALARNCIEDIKEITYDAEDLIENFLLKEEGKKCRGIKNGLRSIACIPGGRKEIAIEITRICKRITTVIHVMKSFGIQPVITDGGNSQAIQERKRVARHTFSTKCEHNLVGWEKNVEKLVAELVEDDSRQVVCISGLGGLGKTTIAQHVFNHEKVKGHFDGGLAWVCISQEFTRMDVWKTILRNLLPKDTIEDGVQKDHRYRSHENKISEMTEDEIQKKLVQLFETRKALIVFDDIWTKKDWDTIKPIFPESNGGAGWKVLLTSRNDGIDPQCVPFKPALLSPEESWTLLQMIVLPKNHTTGDNVNKEMEELAKDMTQSCGGLPLAIKVLGGLLAMQCTLREWKMIHGNIKSHIVGGIDIDDHDSNSVYHVLSLSFEGLPAYLKHCLLYLASFPEDYKIELEKLSYYWAAEEISKPGKYDGAYIRDVGDVYIEELVRRNLVISERDITTSRFETCRLHDMVREICLLKAKEEKFFRIVSVPGHRLHSYGSKKSRRLVVHRDSTLLETKEIMNPKLRSLLFIQDTEECLRHGLCLTMLKLLRILDLSEAKFKGKKLSSSIGKLIYLRYLSLYKAQISYLPSSLGNLKSLLYLDLRVDSHGAHVPNVLNDMQELRYLCLPRWIRGKTKLELGNLVKLETLKNFSTMDGSVRDLECMTKLNTLDIIFHVGGCTLGDLSLVLSKLRHLENLTLDDSNWLSYMSDGEEFVLDCIHLNKLEMMMIYMPRLPDEDHFPSHLTSITLSYCRLVEDPMLILGKLLHLKKIDLGYRSFCGSNMVCSKDGFPQLIMLKINGLDHLEDWIVEDGSMPILRTLVIFRNELLHFPQGIIFLTSLKELRIWEMEKFIKGSLHEGGQYFDNVKHIPSVIVDE